MFVDARFVRERAVSNFKSTCEHCVHFDDDTKACSLTYPNEVHREAHQQALQDGDVLMFCKTFEME